MEEMRKICESLVFGIVFAFPGIAFAGGFVSEPGSVFVKSGFQSWTADKVFAGVKEANPEKGIEVGDSADYDPTNKGEFTSKSISISASYVPIERLAFDFFLPVLQISKFKDLSFESESVGFGDLYLGAGYQVLKFSKVGTTVNLKVKVPTAPPNEDQVSIPLSTGQFDYMLEQQTSWAVKPALHLTLRTLYRYRDSVEGDTLTFNFRDEFELGLEVGGSPVDTLWIKLGTSSLWSLGSDDPTSNVRTDNNEDQIHTLYGGAYWNFGAFLPWAQGLALDSLISVPFGGVSYPRGITWNVGFAYSF